MQSTRRVPHESLRPRYGANLNRHQIPLEMITRSWRCGWRTLETISSRILIRCNHGMLWFKRIPLSLLAYSLIRIILAFSKNSFYLIWFSLLTIRLLALTRIKAPPRPVAATESFTICSKKRHTGTVLFSEISDGCHGHHGKMHLPDLIDQAHSIPI